jgi:signal transduction histidine kinase
VSDHGGRITISDAPGGGARFSIELPLRSGAALLASRI